MPNERNKGQGGMGGKGKNQPRNRQDKATRKKAKNIGGPANLTKPSKSPKANQKRNQKEWASKKKMAGKY